MKTNDIKFYTDKAVSGLERLAEEAPVESAKIMIKRIIVFLKNKINSKNSEYNREITLITTRIEYSTNHMMRVAQNAKYLMEKYGEK